MRTLILFLLFSTPATAQFFTAGVKGSVRATNDIEGYASSESRLYSVGPSIEIGLPHRLSFEFDALYSRFGYSYSGIDILGELNAGRSRANSWEFPLLLKYRLTKRSIGPYALLGYAPRRMSGDVVYSGFSFSYPGGPAAPYRFENPQPYGTSHGLVAGGGVRIPFGRLRFTPEVRYLRWKDSPYDEEGSRGFYIFVPQNEVQILLGVGWSR